MELHFEENQASVLETMSSRPTLQGEAALGWLVSPEANSWSYRASSEEVTIFLAPGCDASLAPHQLWGSGEEGLKANAAQALS